MKTYLIRFHNGNFLCKSIVLANDVHEAKSILLEQYRMYSVDIEIEEYYEIEEKGIALTEYTRNQI